MTRNRRPRQPPCGSRIRLSLVAIPLLLSLHVTPAWEVPSGSESTTGTGETSFLRMTRQAADSVMLRRSAEEAQYDFERTRRRHLELASGLWGGECDEVVGRMCLRHGGEDDWTPPPEQQEVISAREELLAILEGIATALPGDGWVLGQRVLYLGVAGRWGEALALARQCGGVTPWWCSCLEGFALHMDEDFVGSIEAFRRGFSQMEADEARRWQDPRILLDSHGRGWVRGTRELAAEQARRTLWLLGDPLYLVPGNDRETEHYARWVVAELREDSHNPYGLSWGRDLRELLLRYGWEIGWERTLPRIGELATTSVVGHHHPDSRGFLPPGWVLEDPTGVGKGKWIPEEESPVASYAPVYAPRLGPATAQIAHFRRGDSVLVVASYRFPPEESETPSPGDSTLPDDALAGLFLLPGGTIPWHESVARSAAGVLTLSVPPGPYLVSLELYSPGEKRAARLRHGLIAETYPPDVPSLSDLLILRESDDLPTGFRGAIARARPSTAVTSGERILLVWEVYGLGFQREAPHFHVSLRRRDRSLLRRVARWIGLGGDDREVVLSWMEAAPDALGPLFRAVHLDLPELEQGEYTLRLQVELRGRTTMVSERTLDVR